MIHRLTALLLDILHDPADGKKPRGYRKRTRKDYLKYTRNRKHSAQQTRATIRKQLNYLKRDLESVDAKLASGKQLTDRQAERMDTLRKIYKQQKYMYDNKVRSVPDRIVSVSRPFIYPIVKGKVGKPVEFGAKLDSALWTAGRVWNTDPLTPTAKRAIYRSLQSGSVRSRDIIPSAFSRIRIIATGTT